MYISRAKKGAQIRKAQEYPERREAQVWAKIAKQEEDAKNPSLIRDRIKRESRQNLNNVYKQNFEAMYDQTLVSVENLTTLILKDLDLIDNPEKELTLNDILSTIAYYKTNISQLESVFTKEIMQQFLSTKLSPVEVFYKKLISARMEFCIDAPIDSLKINYNYNKVKDAETRAYMLNHLAECGFFSDIKVREKFTKLYNEYLDLKSNSNLNV